MNWERNVNLLAMGLMGCVIYYCVKGALTIEGQIPIHFNLSGTADQWAPAYWLYILAALSLFLHLVLGFVIQNPQHWNTLGQRSQEELQNIIPIGKKGISLLRLVIAAMLWGITLNITHGPQPWVFQWFLPALLLGLIGIVIWLMVKMPKKKC